MYGCNASWVTECGVRKYTFVTREIRLQETKIKPPCLCTVCWSFTRHHFYIFNLFLSFYFYLEQNFLKITNSNIVMFWFTIKQLVLKQSSQNGTETNAISLPPSAGCL